MNVRKIQAAQRDADTSRPTIATAGALPGTSLAMVCTNAVFSRLSTGYLGRLLRDAVMAPYVRRHRRRTAIAQLEALDDRVLSDIGISRGQIPAAVDALLCRSKTPSERCAN